MHRNIGQSLITKVLFREKPLFSLIKCPKTCTKNSNFFRMFLYQKKGSTNHKYKQKLFGGSSAKGGKTTPSNFPLEVGWKNSLEKLSSLEHKIIRLKKWLWWRVRVEERSRGCCLSNALTQLGGIRIKKEPC